MHLKQSKGFTLIESLVCLLITSFSGLIIMTILISGSQIYEKISVYTYVHEIADDIEKEIESTCAYSTYVTGGQKKPIIYSAYMGGMGYFESDDLGISFNYVSCNKDNYFDTGIKKRLLNTREIAPYNDGSKHLSIDIDYAYDDNEYFCKYIIFSYDCKELLSREIKVKPIGEYRKYEHEKY